MAINTISLATAMTSALDKAVAQKAATGFFADNALRAKFVGAGTVLIPEIGISGLGDYDRDGGFVPGAVSVSNRPYTLSQDRGRTFQLDAQDADESGVMELAGEVSGQFVRTQVAPEMDAYCLSKLAAYAEDASQTVAGSAGDALALLQDAIETAQAAVGYDEELVAFMDHSLYAALGRSEELSRQIVLSDFSKGELDLQVRSLNGVALLPVPDERMMTAYDFNDGASEGQTAGGFTPADGADKIGLLVVPKRAAKLVKKTEKVRIFSPEQNPAADAWKIDYRLYYDLFIRNSLGKGIVAFIY